MPKNFLTHNDKLRSVAKARDDIMFWTDDNLPEHRLMPILADLAKGLGFVMLEEEVDNIDGAIWWGDSPR